jgi:nucleotide-binding universal stress UspA family protein
VLVPTDFSAGAERALRRAAQLPLAADAKLLIVHVLPEGPAKLRKQAELEAARGLGSAVALAVESLKTAGYPNVVVASELLSGQAFVEVIRRSRSVSADLIVLGRHGHRQIRHMLLGSTAERVIRNGDVPVLVVNLKAAHPYRRPLIATGLEDSSVRIFELALRTVGPEVNAVPVVHAFHVPFESRFARGESAPAIAFRREYQHRAMRGLDTLLKSWSEVSKVGLGWKPVVRRGDPRSVILLEALRRKADLIIVGTHGRSGIAHALIGSLAEWVIRAARCDVLVARPVRFSFDLP